MAFRFVPGYPYPNEKGGYELILDLDGPASYNNTGVFNTSGQQINALDFSLGGFEDVGADELSSDSVNEVVVALGATIAGATNLNPAPPAGQPSIIVTTAVLHWYTGVRGIGGTVEVANAINLSGKYIRLRLIMV